MYYFDSRVRFSELDENGNISIPSIVDYFQDCSTFQSEDLGVGVKWLTDRDIVWVLNSWQIVIERFPKLGDRLRICTSPYSLKGFMGERNFYMLDEQGEMLVKANSVWTLISISGGHPVRIPQEIYDQYPLEEPIEMEYAPRRISLPKEEGVVLDTFSVSVAQLDTNHHVNNGQYVQMAMEYVEDRSAIKQIRAEYCRQARLGDLITPVVYHKENQMLVALNNEEGKPYAIVSFE